MTNYVGPQAYCGQLFIPAENEYCHIDGYMAAPNLSRGNKKVTAICAQALLRGETGLEDILAVGVETLANLTEPGSRRISVIAPYDGAFNLRRGLCVNLHGYATAYNAEHMEKVNGQGDEGLFSWKGGKGINYRGHRCLYNLIAGDYNTADGDLAGYDLIVGSYNTYKGANAGRGHEYGSHCLFLNCRCPERFRRASHMIFIGEVPNPDDRIIPFLRIDLQTSEIFIRDLPLPLKFKDNRILI